MQTWYLIIGIGTLLIVTTFINNIAEVIEEKNRQKKIKILRLKRGVDDLSDFFDQLKDFKLTKEINDLLQNEIFARLQMIQSLDKSFHGIDDLISVSKEQQHGEDFNQAVEEENHILSETQFQEKISLLRNFTKYIQGLPLKAPESLNSQLDYYDLLVLFRFQMMNQYYSVKAQNALQNQEFKAAREYVNQITGTIALAGHKSTQLTEINEQASIMLKEIDQQQLEEKKRQENETALANEMDENNLVGDAATESEKTKVE